jgi:predicted nucleic acid-binding protein
MELFTLDACAILAMLWNEPGGDVVGEIFRRAKKSDAILMMHQVNLTEVYAIVHKREGTANADKAIELIMHSPIQLFDTMDLHFQRTFAQAQVLYGTHFTDTFVVATNIIHANGKGIIVTADRGFDKVKHENKIQVLYFR